MKIGLYIKNIKYATGGTESYTIRMAQALIEIYPSSKIYLVSEDYGDDEMLSKESFTDLLNHKYGTTIDPHKINYLFLKVNINNKFRALLSRKKIENSSKIFDIFFYCSRGNYIFKAKKNIAIIHFPMEKLKNQRNKINRIHLLRLNHKDRKYASQYDLFLPNSLFTQKNLEKIWPEINSAKIKLLYPPIISLNKLNVHKKNQIFICSRIEKDKKLEPLIDAYKQSDYLRNNFSLIIAGGSDKGSVYLEEIIKLCNGFNIKIYPNAKFSQIESFFNESIFFWHSKGLDIDETLNPYACEHFGMTTVEAMSVGCIPIVINKGGQKEIVSSECGIKWNTLDELISKTEKLATNIELQHKLSQNSIEIAKKYNMLEFTKKLKNITILL